MILPTEIRSVENICIKQAGASGKTSNHEKISCQEAMKALGESAFHWA
jgi:hypothetical protein